MEKTISNHRHYSDFTIVPNEILRREDLPFFSKGLLCYLLSLPDNWEIKVGYIVETFKESERTILRGLKDLIDAGYCKREPKRENGRLLGQRYLITDIPFDFSVPAKNEGAEDSDPALFRPTEISDPRQNEGTKEEKNIYNKEYIYNKEEKRAHTRDSTNEIKCLFADSKFFDFDRFSTELEKDPGIVNENVDINYYYNRVKNWSASGGEKKNDWISTVKNWMLADKRDGKLQRANGGLSPGLLEYLRL